MSSKGDGLLKRHNIAAKDDRQRAQEKIIYKYGKHKIWDAEKRLCDVCTKPCQGQLLPLTGSGEDCPYFDKKEVKNV